MFGGEDSSSRLNLNLSRNLNDWGIEEFEALLQLLSNVQPCDNREK